MIRPHVPQILPAILGVLRQERAEGLLTLEQNDGTRRIHWSAGEIVYLQSDVVGEQFGNYLLRQGILDFPALSELLANEEHYRLGEKVVQWGLMSIEERDRHLRTLLEQVMVHALEHPVIEMDWKAGTPQSLLSEDLHFRLDHHEFVWTAFHEAQNLGDFCDLLYAEGLWRWVAPADLLGLVGDLPLTPQVAYALSFLGPEPMGYETFLSLSGMGEENGAQLLVTLWALGGLTLAEEAAASLMKPFRPVLVLPEPPAEAPVPAPPETQALATPPPLEPRAAAIPAPSQPALPPLAAPNPIELDFLPKKDLETTPADPFLLPLAEMAVPREDEGEKDQETPELRAHKCFLRAKKLLVQERVAEAIRLLELCVKLDPDSDDAYEPWLMLGKYRLSNPAWSTRAIEALQAASKLKPKAAEPWALMGEVYHRKNFRANARACFRKALNLDPSLPVPPDVDLENEDLDTEERSPGLLDRFKSLLGRQAKS